MYFTLIIIILKSYEMNYEQNKLIRPACGSKKVICSKIKGFCIKWCKVNSRYK